MFSHPAVLQCASEGRIELVTNLGMDFRDAEIFGAWITLRYQRHSLGRKSMIRY
jgi:hypothetical protein